MLMNTPPKVPYIRGLEVIELHGQRGADAFQFAEDQQRLAYRAGEAANDDIWSHGELPPEIAARITELTLS